MNEPRRTPAPPVKPSGGPSCTTARAASTSAVTSSVVNDGECDHAPRATPMRASSSSAGAIASRTRAIVGSSPPLPSRARRKVSLGASAVPSLARRSEVSAAA